MSCCNRTSNNLQTINTDNINTISITGSTGTFSTIQATNGIFTNISGTITDNDLLLKQNITSDDNAELIVGDTSSTLSTTSRGFHVGYNTTLQRTSMYSIKNDGSTPEDIYIGYSSLGSSGLSVKGHILTNIITEETTSQGILINNYIRVNSASIVSTNDIILNATSSNIKLNSLTIDQDGHSITSTGILNIGSTSANITLNSLAINSTGSGISTGGALSITTGSTFSVNSGFTVSSAGVLGPLVIADGQNGVMINNASSSPFTWVSLSAGCPADSQSRVVLGCLNNKSTFGGHLWSGTAYTSWDHIYINPVSGSYIRTGSTDTPTQQLSVTGNITVDSPGGYYIGSTEHLNSTNLTLTKNTYNCTFGLANITAARQYTFPDYPGNISLTRDNRLTYYPDKSYNFGSSYPVFTKFTYFTIQDVRGMSFDNLNILANVPTGTDIYFELYDITNSAQIAVSGLVTGNSTITVYGIGTITWPSSGLTYSLGIAWNTGTDPVGVISLEFYGS